MILETAVLHVKPELADSFTASFRKASAIISSMTGYISHELQRCVDPDKEHQFLLLVKWETLEDHVVGFRSSPQYLEWKQLLHHYYDPFPVVEHYESINLD